MASLFVKWEPEQEAYFERSMQPVDVHEEFDRRAPALYVGMLFSSYDEFTARIDEYKRQNSITFTTKYCRALSAAKRVSINEALKYCEICLACADCVKNKSWIKSATSNNVDVGVICEMHLRALATKDGRHLELKKLSEKHNHPLGKTLTVTASGPPTGKKNDLLIGLKRESSTTETETTSPKRRNKAPLDSVSLGRHKERWQRLKKQLKLSSDDRFLELLLNRMEQDFQEQPSSGMHMNPLHVPRPSTFSGQLAPNSLTAPSMVLNRFVFKQEPLQGDDQANGDLNRHYSPVQGINGEESRSSYHSSPSISEPTLVKVDPQQAKVMTHVISDSEEDEPPEIKPVGIHPVMHHFGQNQVGSLQGQEKNREVKPLDELKSFIQKMEQEKGRKLFSTP